MNIACVICGDVFTGATINENIYATQCGHVFHYPCLLEWLERSKTCPQCRNKTSEKNIFRLYFNNTNPGDVDLSYLKYKADGLEFQLKLNEMEVKKLTEEKLKAESQNEGLRKEVKTMKLSVVSAEQSSMQLRDEVKTLRMCCKRLSENKLENEELKRKLNAYSSIKFILEGSIDEADSAVESTDLEAEHLRFCIKQFKQTIKNLDKEHKVTETVLLLCKRKLNAREQELSDIKKKYEQLKKFQENQKTKKSENGDRTATISSDENCSKLNSSSRLPSGSNKISSGTLETKIRPYSLETSPPKNVRISSYPIHIPKSNSLIGVTQVKSATSKRTLLSSSSGDDIYHPNKYVLNKGPKKSKKISATAFTGVKKQITDFKGFNVNNV